MLKQYVFIPRSPKMSAGKIASQACHATFMALAKQSGARGNDTINKWKDSGMCVIVLEANNEAHLHSISRYLEQWNVIHHLYIDEGYTECPPLSATALATGVIDESKEWMFKNFKLFGSHK